MVNGSFFPSSSAINPTSTIIGNALWVGDHLVKAHLKVYQDKAIARSFLTPMADQLKTGCMGTLSEIFDSDPPHSPRGAIAQAWTVAEVLRTYLLTVK